jgi:probable HAF family extracellular repeat protein
MYVIKTNQMTDLGTLPGGLNSYALGMNLKGVIAGASDSSDGTTHAVTWSGTTITDLGNLGGSFAQANAINDSGVAVGYLFTVDTFGNDVSHAFVGNADIGTLGGSSAQANAVDDFGLVVGSSNTTGDADVHAFAWTAKLGMVDLNSLLPAGSPWDLQSANGIGVNGKTATIVGVGLLNGVPHAFSWSFGQ